MNQKSGNSPPLEGLLVADFSRVLAGPLAAATLADLGASVIKVERPATGDDTRGWGPPWAADASAYFHSANRSKRSIELDLDTATDRELAIELASRADVLIENFVTGSLERRGLGYEDLAAVNPGLVYCSISGFGSGGGAGLRGYDFLVQAAGGLMSITGDPEGEQTKVGVAVVDVLTSKDATVAILAALRSREQTGRGQHVEVNLLSSLLASLVNQASGMLTDGQPPSRLGNQHPSIAPYETLRCGDGVLAVCCGNDAQFGKLTAAVGRASMASDPRYATNESRVANRSAMVRELESALQTASVAHWHQTLVDAGIPAGPVNDVSEAFIFAESLGLDPLVSVPGGAPAQVRSPITLSDTPIRCYRRPPKLGEHNEEIRTWLRSPRRN